MAGAAQNGAAIGEHTTDGPPVDRRACRWTRSRESRDSRGISPPTKLNLYRLLRCTYGVGWPRSSSSSCSSRARSKAWASQDVDAPIALPIQGLTRRGDSESLSTEHRSCARYCGGVSQRRLVVGSVSVASGGLAVGAQCWWEGRAGFSFLRQVGVRARENRRPCGDARGGRPPAASATRVPALSEPARQGRIPRLCGEGERAGPARGAPWLMGKATTG